MTRNLKKILPASLLLVSVSMLTACNTVEGTMRGAGRDLNAVSNVVADGSTRAAAPRAQTQKKVVVKKKQNTTATQNNVNGTTTTTTNTSSSTQVQTPTSTGHTY